MSKRIGIALSGGGIRATIFHLGVFKWLAEAGLMENIACVSSVSGGSLAAGLIFAHSGMKWPNSGQYLEQTLPDIERVIMAGDIQIAALTRMFPFWMHRRVNLLARTIGKKWHIGGVMSDLDRTTTWSANCTTYETGKRFMITQDEMGDFVIGFAKDHDFPIADAMAASAGFPFLIGPYALKWRDFDWHASYFNPVENGGAVPRSRCFHLWDGGVYDNLGLGALFNISDRPSGGHLAEGIDFIIVSDAGVASGFKRRLFSTSARRLLDIATDQVGALRSRSVISFIRREGSGMYFKIGRSAATILGDAAIDAAERRRLIKQCLPEHQAILVKNYKTTLRRPAAADFRLIQRHGYEVAMCTSAAM